MTQRAALEYDFRARFRLDITDIGARSLSWRAAADLAAGLLRDPYSHSAAAVAGFAYVPAPADVQFYNWVDATAQMHHQSGKVRPRPVDRPWMATAPSQRAPVFDAGRVERRKALQERLGLSQ